VTTFLLDTDVLSEQTRAKPNARLSGWLARHTAEGYAIASVTLGEVRYGIERHPHGRKRSALERWWRTTVLRLPILAYDRDAAIWHARERARLDKLGTPRPFVDGQIAAVAAVNGLEVVTRNAADYEPFDVVLTDWRRE